MKHCDPPSWPGWCERLPHCPERIAEGGFRVTNQGGGTQTPFNAPTQHTVGAVITYVTAVRNAHNTLERCLKSVQAQTWPHVEHIVIDGASTDGSLEIIEKFAPRLAYYVSEPDQGFYYALNKAVTLATGDFICVLNADDWLEPEAATIAAQAVKGVPAKTMLLTSVYRHSMRKGKDCVRLWKTETPDPGFIFSPRRWCHNGIYASRSLYEAAGLYDTCYRIVADYKWVLQCQRANFFPLLEPKATLHFTEGGISSDGAASAKERLSVQGEAFAFLHHTELTLLCWSLTDTVKEILSQKPANVTQALRDLLVRHADQADFVQALTWAMSLTCQHPADIPISLRKKISRILRRSLRSLGALLTFFAKKPDR